MGTLTNSIVIVAHPIAKASLPMMSDLGRILSKIYDNIIIISGGQIIHLKEPFMKILYIKENINFAHKVIKMISYLIKCLLNTDAEVYIYTLGAELLFPALIIAKLLGRKKYCYVSW
jgi:hypothetical protein